jgi:hypothetical protein
MKGRQPAVLFVFGEDGSLHWDFVIMRTASQWERYVKKLIALSLLLWALVSCSNAVQPTPPAMGASEALTPVTSKGTQQAPTLAMPTLETIESTVTDPADILNPQGNPALEWRGIPIMPEAVAGQEFVNAYSFRVNATSQDVQAFYDRRLSELGWSQPFDSSFNEEGGTMTFRKEGSSLTIRVTPSGDSVVVLLVLTLA